MADDLREQQNFRNQFQIPFQITVFDYFSLYLQNNYNDHEQK